MYEFSVAPNDPSRGTVQIVTAPSCSNWEAQIQATAYHNFRFAHWSDGNTDNPRYIVVTQDVNLEAIFLDESETEGIGDVENGQLSVWCNGSTIIVEGLNGDVAHVFDAMGRQVATSSTIGNCEFELPAGTYLVKVGTSPARKVVVVR